jgi:hypothetical protein
MKMRIVLHRDTLNGLTRNKNIRVADDQNLQKFETLFVQYLNREERTCLKHISIITYTSITLDREFSCLHGGRNLMKLITLYLPEPYIKALDQLVNERFYPNRAEAIRVAIRDLIIDEVRERKRVG